MTCTPGPADDGGRWWDIGQDGLPPHLTTVWIHTGQPTVFLAVLTDNEEWQSALDGEVHYCGVVAWRRFVPPEPPVRSVTWFNA